MIVYEATKRKFIEDVYNDKVAKEIQDKIGFNVGSSEKESWVDTANHMERILRDDRFPNDIVVAMEFKLYNSKMRVDFIIGGLNEEKKHTIIVIEFKRWDNAKVVRDRDDMIEVKAYGIVQHPSYQALSYSKTIKNFYVAAEDGKMDVIPCSCLHRYERKPNSAIVDNHYKTLLEESPIFLNGENDELKDFISRHIKYGDRNTLYTLEKDGIKPSKQLQESVLGLLKGKEEFVMIDSQKDIFEEAKKLAIQSHKDGKKRVYIVDGGPGTGKSVVAINLLGQLIGKYRFNCQYITKNQTPRDCYAIQLKGEYKQTEIDNLFSGSGTYINEKANQFDALIVDEAHRITEKTGFFKKGENQLKEIINASRFSIFFIDPKQKIHIDDYGSIDKIEYFARMLNAEIYYGKLNVQFRCGAANEFIEWVENMLQYEDASKEIDLSFKKKYEIKIFDNPCTMREEIIKKNSINNKSRIVAGYCWKWNKEGENDIRVPDIVIKDPKGKFDFEMSWNLRKNSTIWAVDQCRVEEAGCIYTCQGMDLDYVGVIIGDDLRYENGKVVTDYNKRALEELNNKSLKGIKKIAREQGKDVAYRIADEIIKNTYRTLLTRGQKGCYIYCTNPELAEYMRKSLIEEDYYVLPTAAEDKGIEYTEGRIK